MWVFTQNGFISIVSSREDLKVVMVRARDRQSLEHFIEALDGQDPLTGETLKVLESKGTDYQYRVICSRTAAAQFLADEALSIDYSNFKSRITETRGHEWHNVLMGIWSRALGLNDRPKVYRSPFMTLRESPFVGVTWACEGTTKEGLECHHRARIGYKTCWQHDDQEADIRHDQVPYHEKEEAR